jgi:hypothetical protein
MPGLVARAGLDVGDPRNAHLEAEATPEPTPSAPLVRQLYAPRDATVATDLRPVRWVAAAHGLPTKTAFGPSGNQPWGDA